MSTCDRGEPGAEPPADPAADLATKPGCAAGYTPEATSEPVDRDDASPCEYGGCCCWEYCWSYCCGCAEKGLLEGAAAEAAGPARAAKGSACACGR